MTVHSLIGPSAAHRWMNCPGSVKLSRETGLGGESSPYAEEGTRAHELAESCLKRGLTGVPKGECDDPEMVKGVELFLREVWKAFSLHPGLRPNELLTEQSLSLPHIHADLFGIVDAGVYQSATRTLHTFDFKYGAGIPVEVQGNAQLLSYLLMAIHHLEGKDFKIERTVITIVQPRFDHPDGPVRSAEVSALDLVDFEMALHDAIERVERTNQDTLVPGKWCKFCPARSHCPALHGKALAVAATEFEVIPPGDIKSLVQSLSPDEVGKRLAFVNWLKAYAGGLYAFALAEAERGRPPIGFKLVEKKGKRKWKEPAIAWGVIYHDVGTDGLQLKSPAQIEKLTGKKEFKRWAHLAEAKSSGVKLVPIASKGQALTALEFEAIDEDGETDDE